MREFKFKLYSFNDEEMFYNEDITYIDFSNEYVRVDNNNYSGFYDFGKYGEGALMQYTGLKDKNSVEVYEGDILLYNNHIKTIVTYKNGAFVRSYENSNIYLLYDSFITDGCLDDYEVLGNIYSNPDLLEG